VHSKGKTQCEKQTLDRDVVLKSRIAYLVLVGLDAPCTRITLRNLKLPDQRVQL